MERVNESAPVSPSGRELNSGSQRYPGSVPPMTGRESGLNLSEVERRQTLATQPSMIDYIAPIVAGSPQPSLPKSVGARLKDTIDNAKREEEKYARKGKYQFITFYFGAPIVADRTGRAEDNLLTFRNLQLR